MKNQVTVTRMTQYAQLTMSQALIGARVHDRVEVFLSEKGISYMLGELVSLTWFVHPPSGSGWHSLFVEEKSLPPGAMFHFHFG